MPSGYTEDVADGKVTEFRDFAMNCARAFGALIHMRDDPSSAAIPDVIEPSTYHADRLAEARDKMTALEAMTRADKEAAADAAYRDEIAADARYATRIAEQKSRYDAMIAKAAAWTPPTPDHAEMKNFMLQQLRDSVDFDCSNRTSRVPVKLTADEWYSKAAAKCSEDIARHSEEHAKEVERAASRTAWVKALRQSLT